MQPAREIPTSYLLARSVSIVWQFLTLPRKNSIANQLRT